MKDQIKIITGVFILTIFIATSLNASSFYSIQVVEEITNEKINPQLDITKMKVGQILEIKNLNFAADKFDLDDQSKAALNELIVFLQENTTVQIEIGGHTNNIASSEYCDKLSTARAESVAQFLISEGIETNQIEYYGYGKEMPVTTNMTAEGRSTNQRVEMKILKM